MIITKHGNRVSLCKISTFSIVLRAKGTNFEIYIAGVTELIAHGSFYHCNERVLLASTYYVNIETRVAWIKTAWLRTGVTNHYTPFVLKNKSPIYEVPLFDIYEYLYVFDSKVGYRYNAVKCNMIWHTALQCLKQNTNQMINSKLRNPMSRPEGRMIGQLLWGFGRKLPALGAYFLTPNAASNTTMV